MVTDDREAKLMKLDRLLFAYLYRLKPDDVNIALFHAITSGDLDLARTSLEKGANPKLRDGDIIFQHVEALLNSELRDVFREWLATIHGHDLSLEEKRSTLLAQLVYYLYKEHPDDVNLAFWYAVKTNDVNLARTCVERGGDPNIVDTAMVWPHRDALLASPLADTFLEWFLIVSSPQQPPNLATLMQAFLMAIQSRYSTRILELGERLLAEMDTDAEMAANPGLKVHLQFSLATALLESPAGDREENLLNSVRYFEKVLSLLPATDAATFDPHDQAFDPQLWWRTQANMATAYSRLGRGDRAENIERSIHHYQQALRLLAFGACPQERILTCNNLGHAYRNRIRGDPAANIERAIDFCLEALGYVDLLSLSAEQQLAPHQQASILSNLAACYTQRVFGDRAENLERSINCNEKSLELCSRDQTPDDWALHHRNLSNAYFARIHGDKAENLENAIYHLQQALQVHTRETFPIEWAELQGSLANAYWERIEDDKRSNQERAIFHLEQGLEVFDRTAFPFQWARAHHNLGYMYEHRIAASQKDRITLASEHIKKALEVFTAEAYPAQNRQCHNALGILHFDAGNWRDAHAECEAAIETTQGLLETAYTDVAQRAEVAATSQLYARDAFCLLRLGRTADALLRLERGKMRVLAQAQAISDLDLSTLPEAQRQALEAERRTMRAQAARMRLSGTTGLSVPWDIRESLETTHARLAQLVTRIGIDRADFMPTGLDLPELLALIPERGALVSPLVTSQGSAVFVVPHGADAVTDDHVILLDGFTDGDLRTMLWGKEAQAGWFAAYLDYRISASVWFGRKWFQAIETAGRELWTFLLGPVHERLTRLGLEKGAAVLLMPQGGLGLLPLHAAWRTVDGRKRYFLDDWAITYAPSGYALSVSRKRIQEATRHGRTLLTVVNPTRDLPFTVAEGKAVAALFTEARSLAGDEATVDAVMEAAPVCNYLHFICHGFYNWQDAMQSGLVLAEGKPLTMAEIIAKLDLGRARLITLSACETGLTEIRQSPDEYLGLPAGFLQAGAPAVISTLWPVADLSTMLLMQRFYRNLLGDGGNAPLSQASALREAQQWLRTATAEELSGRDDGLGEAFAALPPAQMPFEHPFHWAAFTFNGA